MDSSTEGLLLVLVLLVLPLTPVLLDPVAGLPAPVPLWLLAVLLLLLDCLLDWNFWIFWIRSSSVIFREFGLGQQHSAIKLGKIVPKNVEVVSDIMAYCGFEGYIGKQGCMIKWGNICCLSWDYRKNCSLNYFMPKYLLLLYFQILEHSAYDDVQSAEDGLLLLLDDFLSMHTDL